MSKKELRAKIEALESRVAMLEAQAFPETAVTVTPLVERNWLWHGGTPVKRIGVEAREAIDNLREALS